MIYLKNPDQIAKMRSAGHMLYDVLQQIREAIKPGVTTKELDKLAEHLITKQHAVPSFLNYEGYPASICASIDDEVVHGIPSDVIELKEGSIISIDGGLILDGWQADSAFTVGVGEVSDAAKKLMKVTEESFFLGAAQATSENRLQDIGYAVQTYCESFGYGVIRDLTGHGIGREMHEDPAVPNYGRQGHGVRLRRGMALAIEPMIAMGHYQVHQLADGWTIVTNDHSICSHYEHTCIVNEHGKPELTTLPAYKWENV